METSIDKKEIDLEMIALLFKRDNLQVIKSHVLHLEKQMEDIEKVQKLMDLKIELILSKLRILLDTRRLT
jgi:hypothetical protein